MKKFSLSYVLIFLGIETLVSSLPVTAMDKKDDGEGVRYRGASLTPRDIQEVRDDFPHFPPIHTAMEKGNLLKQDYKISGAVIKKLCEQKSTGPLNTDQETYLGFGVYATNLADYGRLLDHHYYRAKCMSYEREFSCCWYCCGWGDNYDDWTLKAKWVVTSTIPESNKKFTLKITYDPEN